MGERMQSLTQNPNELGWRESVLQDLDALTRLPAEYVHKGPVFEVEAKAGKRLTCENYLLDLEECVNAGLGHLVENAFIGGERAYLVAKDEAGNVIGTRISSLFHEKRIMRGKEGVLAKSKIKIVEKGQGLAWPVERAFLQFLQFYADSKRLPVVWKIENQNLERLEEYRAKEDANPAQLQSMEEEQKRWQVLYGNGGRLGITDGKKVVEPRVCNHP